MSILKNLQINCKAYNSSSDTAIDLSPLISSSGNYLAKVSDSLKSTEGPPVLVRRLYLLITNKLYDTDFRFTALH